MDRRPALLVIALLLILAAGLAAGWYTDHRRAQADRQRAQDAHELLYTVDHYYFADEPLPQRVTTQIFHRGRRFRVLVEPLEPVPIAKADGPK